MLRGVRLRYLAIYSSSDSKTASVPRVFPWHRQTMKMQTTNNHESARINSISVHSWLIELGKSLFALSGIQPKMRDCRAHIAAVLSILPRQGTGLTVTSEPWI